MSKYIPVGYEKVKYDEFLFKMSNSISGEGNAKYSSSDNFRWKTYRNYRLIVWTWMLNEFAISIGVAVTSHNGFYIHLLLYLFGVIIIGIPLAYSEICLAQYTNCGVISLWNFFPIFRSVGYGTIYLVILKYIHLMVITSWYLQYTFYAAMDPPPWYSCDDFNKSECMVKRINVSIFQHCLEAQLLFDVHCGIKTASNCFFEREIGNNNTMTSLSCVFSWKSIISSSIIGCILFTLSLRNYRFIQMAVRVLAMYICVVILVLLSVALSTKGAWYATKVNIDWSIFSWKNCFNSTNLGFLSVGTGCGVIGFLSRDVPFRSPATMTAISTSLLAVFVTCMFSLIIFSGIKTMSYYHGEEENVIEMGVSIYFLEFASTSEILSYFDQTPIWGFAWFSSTCLCLICNLWILHTFLKSLIVDSVSFARRHTIVLDILITSLLCLVSWPIFCVDITGAFINAIQIIQIASSFMFSMAIYWFYGYQKHNVDIIFMIGIKASYFWKTAWIINPVMNFLMLYTKLVTLETQPFDDNITVIKGVDLNHDVLIIYVLVGIYALIIIVGIVTQLILKIRSKSFRDAFVPGEDWGPKHTVLLKSRQMFIPEIMTREFLYRQVRIHGYTKNKKVFEKRNVQFEAKEDDETEWSTLTSN